MLTKQTLYNNLPPFNAIIFLILVAVYALVIVLGSDLGPTDEYAFLHTLQSGKVFPFYGQDSTYLDTYKIGRFVPLGGQEFNLVALFTNKPWAYFTLNSFEFILFAILLLKILQQFSANQLLNYFSVLLLFFIPGVTITYYKLMYVEKNVVFLMAVFFASYLSFLKEKRAISFILVLCSANIAMYYKETVFSAIAVFAAAHLYLSWKKSNLNTKVLDALLVASSAIYVILYFTLVFPHRGEITYNLSIYDPVLVFVKNLINYSLFSDPIPILVFPLFIMRLYQIFVEKREAHLFLDSSIAAGATYVTAYLFLNMYTPYYLLPAYLCVLPPLLYFYGNKYLSGVFWKICLIIVGLVLITNTIPSGVHYLTFNKYQPINFNKTINYLISDINRRNEDRRIGIFMDGVDSGTGQSVYMILGEFLKYEGLSILKFDLKSNKEAVDKRAFEIKQSPFDKESDLDKLGIPPGYPRHPFTVLQKVGPQTIARGDYLIVSPDSVKDVSGSYLESLKNDYLLVYKTESLFAMPSINLKMIVKYIASEMPSSSYNDSSMIVSKNLMNWPDYYIFVKK